jgi:hypothetical protein
MNVSSIIARAEGECKKESERRCPTFENAKILQKKVI